MKANMIILGLASLWALYWTFRNKHVFSGLITLGLIAGIILAFLKPNNSILIGLTVFLISASIALVYTILYKRFNFDKRMVLGLIILPTFLYWIFLVNHLQGAGWLWYGLFLPFIALIYGLIRSVNLKKEWGFVIILLAEAFTHIYPVLINQKLF